MRSCHDSIILSDQYQVYDQKVDFYEVFRRQVKQNVLKNMGLLVVQCCTLHYITMYRNASNRCF